MTLPPFPVDDATLDLLTAALNPREHGDPEAASSSVWPLLTMLSQLGGSDTDAVAEVVDDGSDGGARVVVMRDPEYHEHDVLAALIAEVRRLRAQRVGTPDAHRYLSTACQHGLHGQCRQTCKFCQVGCACDCGHLGEADTPHTVLAEDHPACPNHNAFGRPCIFPKHGDEQVCRFPGTAGAA